LAGGIESLRVGILKVAGGHGAHAAAAGVVVGLLDDGVASGFNVLFVESEVLVVVTGA
jgi:hypothetical protein